jgi:uncharacterized protein YraI
MLPKLSVVVLAVAAAGLPVPAFAQTSPETTIVRATDLLRGAPPHGGWITGVAKGARVELHECVGEPTWCKVVLLDRYQPIAGWVDARALDGAVSAQ